MVSVIIVAAGIGQRFREKKQFVKIELKPLIAYTVDRFNKNKNIDEIIVIIGKRDKTIMQQIIEKYDFNKVRKIIGGGERRIDSVYQGIKACSKDTSVCLIHDGVRPNVSERIINEIVKKAQRNAVICGIKPRDTVKMVEGNKMHTLNRKSLILSQTPQGFPFKLFSAAIKRAIEQDKDFTDDAAIWEWFYNGEIGIVEGDRMNIKITYKEDMELEKCLLKLV
jgi:2-C-methyl-D-erythritol 4-phosphate cytidylyltransferase